MPIVTEPAAPPPSTSPNPNPAINPDPARNQNPNAPINPDPGNPAYDNTPKEGGATGSKSPLQEAKNAVPVEQVARGRETEIKGGGDPYSLEEGAQQTATGRKLTKENAWENYVVQAANKIYPRYRNTTDYAIGRKDIDSPIEILGTAEGVEIDLGRIQEEAQFLAEQDPRGPFYVPRPPIAPRPAWGEGEHRTD